MNEAFEKITSSIKELADYNGDAYIDSADIIEIVQEVAEEYKDGWIPCSERLPEEYGDYLVWWTDMTRGQYYEIVEYEPDNGWIGEIPQAFEGKYSVIAWQPLPEPFKELE